MITSLLIHCRTTPDVLNRDNKLDVLYTPPETHHRVLELLSSPAKFPRLESLRIVYGIAPYCETFSPRQGVLPFNQRVQDAWRVPWEKLLASRRWRRFEVTVLTDWEACFQELRRRRSKLQTREFTLNAEFEYSSVLRLACEAT